MSDPKTAVVKPNDVRALIESPKFKDEAAKVLPKHCTPERMARVALTAIMKTPALLNCTPASVMNSLMLCSQAGLEPDGRLAHLIPYGTTCQVVFDWKGLVALALRNGYESVYADKVCDGDFFEATVENGERKITHRINWKQPRGEAYAYYAVCKRGGVVDYEVMSKAEVDASRARSWAGKSGPWVTDYDEMGKKCPLRRMSKRWDLLPEIRDVVNSDDDTPGFDTPKVSAPIFSAPAKKDGLIEIQDEPPRYDQIEDGDEEPTKPPSKPDKKPDTSPSGTIKSIRSKLSKEKVSELALIAFLKGMGVIEELDTIKSLEDVHTASDTAIAMLQQQLEDVIRRMKEAQ